MSGLFRSPGNDPFEGGARFALAPPTARSGTLDPPGGSVQNPLSVSAPSVNMARNNRGSNIQIPHARIVPLSPADTALPDITDTDGLKKFMNNSNNTSSSVLGMLESEALAPGRLGFVLGRRAWPSKVINQNIKLPGFQVFAGTIPSNNWTVARGMGHGVDRVDRMCSFEYLSRYFSIVLRRGFLKLDEPAGVPAGSGSNEPDTGGMLKQWLDQQVGGGGFGVLHNVPDVVYTRDNDATYVGTNTKVAETPMGICAHDIHPFIRGKSLETDLVSVKKGNFRFKYSRAVGDIIAISELENELGKMGLFDWRPDGVVVGKEDSGQGSAEMDGEFDARLQQLFNVAVQGPAITTCCVGNRKLASLPGDRIFVAIVCDRIDGDEPTDDSVAEVLDTDGVTVITAAKPASPTWDYWKLYKEEAPSSDDLRKFEEARSKALNEAISLEKIREAAEESVGTAGRKAVLCNFRLRMTTSAEMIATSGVAQKPDTKTDETNIFKFGEDERMGLRFGERMAEYIIGGWSIGRVMDSAASRAALPGQYVSNRDPTSHAMNIDVGVEWWSGDRMYRTYCDREGKTFLRRQQKRENPRPVPQPDRYFDLMPKSSRRLAQR